MQDLESSNTRAHFNIENDLVRLQTRPLFPPGPLLYKPVAYRTNQPHDTTTGIHILVLSTSPTPLSLHSALHTPYTSSLDHFVTSTPHTLYLPVSTASPSTVCSLPLMSSRVYLATSPRVRFQFSPALSSALSSFIFM